MPHLILDVTPRLASQIDWGATLAAIHAALAGRGFAALETIKSRVHVATFARSGSEVDSEQLVARLITTRERPAEMRAAMAQLVHEMLSEAVARLAPSTWVQCCVLQETAAAGSYLLRQWNPPARAPRVDR